MSAKYAWGMFVAVLVVACITTFWGWAGWRWGRLVALAWIIGVPIGIVFSILAQRRANARDRRADARDARADARMARIDTLLTTLVEHWGEPAPKVRQLLTDVSERTKAIQP